MAKSDFLRQNEPAFSGQQKTFKNTIGSYAVLVGVSPAQVTAQAADSDYYEYTLACREIAQNSAQQWSDWRNLMRNGGTPPPTGAPVVPPVFPDAVPAVEPGIEARFRALVKQIKASPGYNTGIGEALGIEGAVQVAPDFAALQPIITVEIAGGSVAIGWGWQGNSAFLDMLEIEVDRNDGKGFVMLAFDTTPNYVDTTPFPATPTKWTYRAIYRLNDSRVGQWSSPVNVTVGG